MRTGRYLRMVLASVGRHWSELGIAGSGVALCVAVLVVSVALSAGLRTLLPDEFLSLDTLEVVPKTRALDFLMLRIPLSDDEINEATLASLRSMPGVTAVYPKQKLKAPAVAMGGASLLGEDAFIEVLVEGIAPELVQNDVAAGYVFADREGAAGSTPTPCARDQECSKGLYCEATIAECVAPIPVLLSPRLVELYNTSVRRAYHLPRLNPDAAIGLTARLQVGASLFSGVNAAPVMSRRMELVGFSRFAHPLGITIPLTYVSRCNARIVPEDGGERYHSVILELAAASLAPEVTARLRGIGLEVANKGQESAALTLLVVTIALGLLCALVLVVTAANIMNVFTLLLSSRRRELATLRALGARAKDIRRLVIGEAAAVGLVAGMVGTGLGVACCGGCDWAFDRFVMEFPYKPESLFMISAWLLGGALVFAVGTCLLSVALPARRAARLDPARGLTEL